MVLQSLMSTELTHFSIRRGEELERQERFNVTPLLKLLLQTGNFQS